ncbi:MAG TPA: hypothetical protein DEQ80_11765 [Anaerolinea thermolimosa]|uniref:Uncharacterized protein n=1 Tax=Anaerolinea thermolimosa TaxID=229919 RepID=A0A3D1JLJ4_9CHLR|nr:helix-turn-helix domain-containing protein [Anaerolinea thermolimosa]GAP05906.1 hypothetical protein ATHL_00747 [Anaerolinea thermolimosa]HCE18526.1 hypothetical protein [Anaerolinea thermolimosa]
MPKNYDTKVHDYAREKYRLGYSAAETVRQMERDTRLADFDLPTRRTVEHWFAKFSKEETTDEWSPEETPPEDARIILAHWKRSVEWAVQNGFSRPIISKVLAARLVWVHKVAPDIPLALAWILANTYFDTPDKTYWHLLLATKAWQSKEANDEFYHLAKALFGPPIGDLMVESPEDYHRRYPLGATAFYLFSQSREHPSTQS